MKETISPNITKKEFLSKAIGDPVFLIGVRYSYRGTIVSVSDDAVVLKDAFAVFSTGALNNKTATNEEALPGINLIALDAIEGIFPFLPFILK